MNMGALISTSVLCAFVLYLLIRHFKNLPR